MGGAPFVIIDGASNTASQPAIAVGAQCVAVNPLQNKVILGALTAGVYDPVLATSFAVTSSGSPRGYSVAALNTVTNQAYLVSGHTNTVGVLDGANGYAMTTSIPVGFNPVALAVDPVRNKVYVVGKDDNSLTVIDGASNTPALLVTGTRPASVAVNPLTNKIYVANLADSTVTAVDGVTGAASTIHVGTAPVTVDVDPVANKIYTANSGSSDVTVIDGGTNITTSIRAGTNPIGVIVNPQTGKAYVASSGDNTITVIDSAAGIRSTILVGSFPANPSFFRMAVNQITNRIYVPISGTGVVTAIDGATNGTSNIIVGGSPFAVAVNPVTNRVYVANGTSGLAVIDANTNLVTTIPIGFNFFDVAANPITNRIYTLGAQSTGSIAVVDGDTAQVTNVPLPISAATTVLAADTVTNKIYAGSLSAASSTGVGLTGWKEQRTHPYRRFVPDARCQGHGAGRKPGDQFRVCRVEPGRCLRRSHRRREYRRRLCPRYDYSPRGKPDHKSHSYVHPGVRSFAHAGEYLLPLRHSRRTLDRSCGKSKLRL